MKNNLATFILLVTSLFVISCATQTSVIKSLHSAKKSIVKLETWVNFEECGEEATSCRKPELLSMGSGAVVLYNRSKVILTAAHICAQEEFEMLTIFDQRIPYLKAIDRDEKEYLTEIIKYDNKEDICLLRSVSGDLPGYLKISSKKPEYGEIVYNLGGPLGIIKGEMVPVFQGQFFGTQENRAFYSIPVIGGSSGSPIVNAKGELIGMIHSVHYRFHHISLSATYKQLWNFLKIEQSRTLEFLN